MSLESIPKDLRNLRACLLCSMIKSFDQFEYDGCDNCEEYLNMKGNRELVDECTSSTFDGSKHTYLYLFCDLIS
ncbi:UNVERIFIED_CONTAM: supt4h1 [Trichonephila clavipes]